MRGLSDREVELTTDRHRVIEVGEPGDVELPQRQAVRFAGRLDDLAPIYDRHRVFVAPTRFAAGIPLKVVSAAAHGLPAVATSLLTGQLGWTDGDEIVDGGENDPERFAERVVELYERSDLWQKVRRGAVDAVERSFGTAAFDRSIGRAIKETPPRRAPAPRMK